MPLLTPDRIATSRPHYPNPTSPEQTAAEHTKAQPTLNMPDTASPWLKAS